MPGKFFLLFVITISIAFYSFKTIKIVYTSPQQQTLPQQPQAMREFRAAWVATVANINWPSRPGLPVDSQKIEAIALLDFLQAHHFNAVILQVRPQADA